MTTGSPPTQSGRSPLPSLWGSGAVLATSGLDDVLDAGHRFVGQLLADRIGFRFPTMEERRLWFEVPPGVGVERQAWVGSALRIQLSGSVAGAPITVAAADPWTMVGRVPASVRIRSGMAPSRGASPSGAGIDYTALLTGDAAEGLRTFSYAYSAQSADDAARRAEAGLHLDADIVFDAAVQWLTALRQPELGDEALNELYLKAAAVLRQNVVSPPASPRLRLASPWRMPDAEPEQLGSAIAACAWTRIDPQVAIGILGSILDRQDAETGLVPGSLGAGPEAAAPTHPPLLVRAAEQIALRTGRTDFLDNAYERLKKHVRGWILNRVTEESGLLAWQTVEGAEPGFEAGMGNSPRFAGTHRVIGADLNFLILREIADLHRIADRLHAADDPELAWFARAADAIRGAVGEVLWDDSRGAFRDRCEPPESGDAATSAIFVPLWAGGLPAGLRARLMAQLADAATFRRPLPLPSVSAADSTRSDDFWTGPVWPHMNAWVVAGLRAAGDEARARDLAQVTLEELHRWYAQEGVLFEFYDAEGARSPRDLRRLGRRGARVDTVQTAAAVVDLCWDLAELRVAPQADRESAAAPGARRHLPRTRVLAAAGTAGALIVAAALWAGLALTGDRPAPNPAPARPASGLRIGAPVHPVAPTTPPAGQDEPGGIAAVRPGPQSIRGLLRDGRTADAVRLARQALATPEADPELHYWLAAALWQTGDTTGAIRAAEDLLAAGEDGALPELRSWADRFLQRARSRSSDPAVEPGHPRSSAGQTDTPSAASAAANRLTQAGDVAAATAVLRRQTEIHPGQPAAWSHLAAVLGGAGDVEGARRARAMSRRLSETQDAPGSVASGDPGLNPG